MPVGIIYISAVSYCGWSTYPPKHTPLRNKGLMAGLMKGNQWFINPYFIRNPSYFMGFLREGLRQLPDVHSFGPTSNFNDSPGDRGGNCKYEQCQFYVAGHPTRKKSEFRRRRVVIFADFWWKAIFFPNVELNPQ